MHIDRLQELYSKHPAVSALKAAMRKQEVSSIHIRGLQGSASALIAAGIRQDIASPFLFILNDSEEAGYFYHDLIQLCGEEQVFFFPSAYKRAIKYGQKDAANEILRTEVLTRLQQQEPIAIVTYPEALCEKVVSHQTLASLSIEIKRHDTWIVDDLLKRLISLSFKEVDYVYEPGQFALRGSILDTFSFASEQPYRIDFFGDEVDSIRIFEVETQLSKDKCEKVHIIPEMTAQSEVALTEFLPQTSVVFVKDLLWLFDRAKTLEQEVLSAQAAEAQKAETGTVTDIKANLVQTTTFIKSILSFRRIEFGHKPYTTPQAEIDTECSIQPVFRKNFDLLASTFNDFLQRHYTIYICSDSSKQTERLRDIFAERHENIVFEAVDRTLHEGFVDHTTKRCVFTDHQIFDRFHKYNLKSDKARSGKVALSLKELNLFEPGDYVVHIDHGIGQFAGLMRVPNGETTQEMIKLVYRNNDVVFVSIHSLHKISKYKGKEGEPPAISKLGTGAWEKIKERTKSKIKDIARDLIRLYSQRKQEKGFSYSPDSFLQHELEASFLYEDTPDQMKATQEVKQDMESHKPMDRLVCGDVGFGKTEVAMRAAFKAVADNKQVAVLVPTTVLAHQHYQTFGKRLKDFPCRVEYLSRARTAKETGSILKDLADGKVNILIGTHKLIGKNVKFKDLGLLIIDEEQKFGVSVKEKLRQMKVNVDTLTMTATPIPRTLQFSLMGARDLSVIQTPPPNRYPVQTEVHTFNEEIITEAINFEMSRNGQVFFVNNRIQGLQELKAMILRHIPDCRVCIAHGQMPPTDVEKVIVDFVNYDYDVLLATTIIESGIDIPNANTIIINEAHNFGLSDLHQMRGRVGRSNRKAFCYLLAPALSLLTPVARRRLQAIENFSDLGSGIHIAMQDLDIRGAGNMLGAEQSGFIAELGYETYQKILSEAVKELKNEEFAELYGSEVEAREEVIEGKDFVDECTVESDFEVLLPANYVPSSSERMLLYRELDGLQLDKEVEAFTERLQDRFGNLPPETQELLLIVPLRRLAKQAGFERIVLKSGKMLMYFVNNDESPYFRSRAFDKILRYLALHCKDGLLQEQNGRRRVLMKNIGSMAKAVEVLREMNSMELD